MKCDNIHVLYLYIIFLSVFIVFGYFIIAYHSVESFIAMVLISDGILLLFYDYLSDNCYVLLNRELNFKSFFLTWAVFFLIYSYVLFPKNDLNRYL